MDEDGMTTRLQPTLETAFFRIAQEAITNAARYAKPSSVTVRLISEWGYVTMQIADDGQGFDPETLDLSHSHGQGLGLRGMQERAMIMGGTLKLETAPGQGTTITVCVPVTESEVVHAAS
jgi:signal transduction histidine kinase